MTTTTITFIVLSALLLVAVFFLGRVAYISGRRAKHINRLKAQIKYYRMAADDEHPAYMVKWLDLSDEVRIFGQWAVVRRAKVNGYIYETLIKVFTDEDDEFNKNEAEELCEILNS